MAIDIETMSPGVPAGPASGNLVEGNYVGVDVTGARIQGNLHGISLGSGVTQNTIGGTTTGARNIISGTYNEAIGITGIGNDGNVVEGNFLGTDASGVADLGNGNGIYIVQGSNDVIGGTASGAGNVIAFGKPSPTGGTPGYGVVITSGTGDAILGNSIYDNAVIGIVLGGGQSSNAPGGPHSGPNDLQNYPVITAATTSGGTTEIQGTLNSTANLAFRIEFFANDIADPSGYGQGRLYLGFATVTTNADGNANFDALVPAAPALSPFISATATDPAGNTSEFALDAKVQPPAANPLIVTTIADSGPGSLRAAITYANANTGPGPETISFNIPGAGVHTITPLSALPAVTVPVTIDGYTQPGSSPGTNGPGLGDNAVLGIELRGDSAGINAVGLVLSGGNSTIRGLAIDGFNSTGIDLTNRGGDAVAGDFVGLRPDGTPLANLGDGVLIDGVTGNTIGGTTPGSRNVLSGNGGYGEVVIVRAGATANLVAGNLLGTNPAGTGTPLPLARQSSVGVYIDGAPGNTIGGTTPSARNVIALHTLGVDIIGPARRATSSRATMWEATSPARSPWPTSMGWSSNRPPRATPSGAPRRRGEPDRREHQQRSLALRCRDRAPISWRGTSSAPTPRATAASGLARGTPAWASSSTEVRRTTPSGGPWPGRPTRSRSTPTASSSRIPRPIRRATPSSATPSFPTAPWESPLAARSPIPRAVPTRVRTGARISP